MDKVEVVIMNSVDEYHMRVALLGEPVAELVAVQLAVQLRHTWNRICGMVSRPDPDQAIPFLHMPGFCLNLEGWTAPKAWDIDASALGIVFPVMEEAADGVPLDLAMSQVSPHVRTIGVQCGDRS